MSASDDDSPTPDRAFEAADREAILARRSRFIALALGGLAAAAGASGCDGIGPTACLDIAPIDAGPSDAGPDGGDGGDADGDAG